MNQITSTIPQQLRGIYAELLKTNTATEINKAVANIDAKHNAFCDAELSARTLRDRARRAANPANVGWAFLTDAELAQSGIKVRTQEAEAEYLDKLAEEADDARHKASRAYYDAVDELISRGTPKAVAEFAADYVALGGFYK